MDFPDGTVVKATSNNGIWAPSLVGKITSHALCGSTKKKKKKITKQSFTNPIKNEKIKKATRKELGVDDEPTTRLPVRALDRS